MIESDRPQAYRKLDQRQHVLLRPAMYVGAILQDTCTAWVMDPESRRMISREVSYVPALFKIFDEVLMNAVDQSIRVRKNHLADKSVVLTRAIQVTIDRCTGIISVENDGDGIDVEMHAEHNVFVPELLFGHLLTSANFDTCDDRTVGGQNGIGAKACNIFSLWFEVQTLDHRKSRMFRQMFRDNMSVIETPTIGDSAHRRPFTKVTFLPDYALFGYEAGHLSDDMLQLMTRRVYDVTAVTEHDVSVSLNGERIDCKTFERYIDLYLGSRSEQDRAYERVNEWWEVAASVSDGLGLTQVSFVNGMSTIRGGKHVDFIVGLICRRLVEMIAEKRKVHVKPQHVRDNLFVFVKATVPCPSFDSQTKETLTTPSSKFGLKVELSSRFMDKLYKTDLVTRVIDLTSSLTTKTLTKTDGRLVGTVTGIPKLDDAAWAGTKKGFECTLVLTEGDSAKSMAIAGLAEVGRERYGVFPLRGKLMNVCDASAQRISDNVEIACIKKIMGLESGKIYVSRSELRYGRVMIMTDQDLDGSHIKGLVMNMFFQLWPSLLRIEGFLASMLTPIVKAHRGVNVVRSFFNMTDLRAWQAPGSEGSANGWKIKYYKGLGTSTGVEAREYFKRMRIAVYTWDDEGSSANSLDLAFNKRRSDDRKAWLHAYDRDRTLDYGRENVSYEAFVDRDLIHFSNHDVERSIPSVIDGLKISQRKVMYACFKRHLVSDEIRVAQLAGYVSEHAAYHHGEMSLVGTIVNLAQTYVGSNNINLLLPNGQFGTRLHGGRDAASARYIHTRLSPLCSLLFLPTDDAVLTKTVDDGDEVEPRTYLPIIPLVLVNGAVGIGTGFSTNVPSYNPVDVVESIRRLIAGHEIADELLPWYSGFMGSIERTSGGRVISRGVYTRSGPTQICVRELPVGVWTQDFKEMLDEMLSSKGDLKRVEGAYTDTKVDFKLTYSSPDVLDALLLTVPGSDPPATGLETTLKLLSNKGLSLTNMYLFGPSGAIKKYGSTKQILTDFFEVRLLGYDLRKIREIEYNQGVSEIARSKVRFIELLADGRLLLDRTKDEVETDMLALDLHKVQGSFDHLLNMPFSSLTLERKATLILQLGILDARLDVLRNEEARVTWSRDLDNFMTAYATVSAESEKRVAEIV